MNLFVIGGGAAGMMAAIIASQNGAKVKIIEKNNKLGKKLYITGKGRCNLTNLTTYDNFLNNIISNPKFMCGALKLMSPINTIDFFENFGLKTKVERGNRVFPFSDKSSDVIKTLEKALQENSIEIIYDEEVIDFEKKDNLIFSIKTDKNEYFPDKVVLATGGMSYKSTGSDGMGYKLAKKLGHSIVPIVPALCSILLEDVSSVSNRKINLEKMPRIEGLSLKNVEARIIEKISGKVLFKEFGEMVFTENGVSGPIILTLSSKINRINPKNIKIIIDCKPVIDFDTLDKRLQRIFLEKNNKIFKNSLKELLPSSLIPFIIKLSEIDEDTKVCSITKLQRKNLVNLIKGITFDIKSLDDINNAIISSVGISTKEINPKTMPSKLIENL